MFIIYIYSKFYSIHTSYLLFYTHVIIDPQHILCMLYIGSFMFDDLLTLALIDQKIAATINETVKKYCNCISIVH